MFMFKKSSMKAIPLAAMTAALLFGASAYAQTSPPSMGGAPTDMGSPSKGPATPDSAVGGSTSPSPEAAGSTKGKSRAMAGSASGADTMPANPQATGAPEMTNGKDRPTAG